MILDQIKSKIKQLRQIQDERQKLEGRMEALMKQLNDLGCSSVEEAQQLLKSIEEEIAEAEKKLTNSISEMDEIINKAREKGLV